MIESLFFKQFWRHRRWAIGVVAASLVIGLVYLRIATYEYTAKLVLVPVQQSSQQLDPGLTGLASIAGINLGSGAASSPFDLFEHAFVSPESARELVEDDEIMRTIFASHWDDEAKEWAKPGGIRAAINSILFFAVPSRARDWAPPNEVDLENYLRKTVQLAQKPGEAVLNVSFRHPQPEFARYVLQELFRVTDDLLRSRSLQRTDEYIKYIDAKIAEVSVAEHRQALARAYSEQERLRMIAGSGLPHAAEAFGPVVVSTKPTSPRPGLVMLASIVFGLAFVTITIAILSSYSIAIGRASD